MVPIEKITYFVIFCGKIESHINILQWGIAIANFLGLWIIIINSQFVAMAPIQGGRNLRRASNTTLLRVPIDKKI